MGSKVSAKHLAFSFSFLLVFRGRHLWMPVLQLALVDRASIQEAEAGKYLAFNEKK